MKKTSFPFLPAALAALAFSAPQAVAELRYENSSGGSVTIYGQFNTAFQWVDDGITSENTLVDNAHSNSRAGLWLRQPMGEGMFTFNFETALGLRQSDGVSQTFTPEAFNWRRTNLRKVDFAYAHDRYGKIYLGQGSMATDGAAEEDFSGTGLAIYSLIGDTAGSFEFRTAAGTLSGVAIGDVAPNFDGSRRGRIRYDTPEFSGFKLSLAAGEDILSSNNDDEFYDIALRYGADLTGAEIAGAIGFSRRDRNGVDRDDTLGSLSVLLDSGWNFTVAAGSRGNDGDYVYGKAGFLANWFPAGTTAVAVDIYDGSDFNSAGSSTEIWGIGAVQKIDNLNLEAYLGYRSYDFAETTVAYQDISSVLFGARWKF